jgi:hypothetical protein
MRELRTYGSGRGALSNGRPYRDRVQAFQLARCRRVRDVCTGRSRIIYRQQAWAVAFRRPREC